MNSLTLRIVLILMSVVLALLACIISAVIQYATGNRFDWSITIGAILICLLTSLALGAFIDQYILKSIHKILLTVRNNRNINKQSLSVSDNVNEIDALDEEINAWTNERKNEIDRLQKLETYRKEFLGNVSHELKTPIFNIQGYVHTLIDGGLEDPSINKEYLNRASKSVDRMIHIVEDLEAISQLETGELTLDIDTFDIVALAKDVADAEEIRATAKGIILNLPADNKPVYVSADRFRIRQVITNLVVNSIKYGKEYGETKIRFNDLGNVILVEISDNGIGITPEHLPRLFERFYRVDKGRSRDQGGTGLGLSIVKHIIEAHQQSINVSSTKDAGTTFSFTLPKAL